MPNPNSPAAQQQLVFGARPLCNVEDEGAIDRLKPTKTKGKFEETVVKDN